MKVTGLVAAASLLAFALIGGALYVVVFTGHEQFDFKLAEAAVITSFLGPIGVAVAALSKAERIDDRQQQIQKDVNGHLQAHIGHTDAQIQQMIRDELATLRLPSVQLEQRPPSDEEKSSDPTVR